MPRHLTYANVMATIAVFLALGGVSWAAVKLGRGAVKGPNIATNAVGSRAVLDRSLLAKDFRKGQLAAAVKGEPGLQGPAGPAGAAGRDGAAVVGRLALDNVDLGADATTYAELPQELRWTQPAGTLDRLEGVATVSMAQCFLAEKLELQVVRDGLEVSADSAVNGDTAGNGPPDTGDSTFVTALGGGVAFTETQPLPIEVPWSETAGEHVVKLRVRHSCAASPTAKVVITSLRLWAVRAAG